MKANERTHEKFFLYTFSKFPAETERLPSEYARKFPTLFKDHYYMLRAQRKWRKISCLFLALLMTNCVQFLRSLLMQSWSCLVKVSIMWKTVLRGFHRMYEIILPSERRWFSAQFSRFAAQFMRSHYQVEEKYQKIFCIIIESKWNIFKISNCREISYIVSIWWMLSENSFTYTA